MDRRTVLGWVGVVGGMAGVKALTEIDNPDAEQDDRAGAETGGSGEVKTETQTTSNNEETANGPDPEAVAETVVELINLERQDRQTAKLRRDRFLREPAREHSADMHDRDFYGHDNPDGEGPQARAPCEGVAENLHRGDLGRTRNRDSQETWDTTTADGMAGYVFEGWLLSDRHRKIMVDRTFERVGVGVHVGESEFFATAMFC